MISLVALARIPSLGSFLPREKPGLSVSTMKALTPLCFFSGAVIMKTTMVSA